MSFDYTKAMTEPIEKRQIFAGWDAAKGKDTRRQELCARQRSAVNTFLRFECKAVMRLQSFWRLTKTDKETIEKLAERMVEWERLLVEGDDRWWELTRKEKLSLVEAMNYDVEVPQGAKEVPNPFFGSTEKPKCRANYRLFVMGESPSSSEFGTGLEMETLAQWASSIIESAENVGRMGKSTRQLQNGLKRKLEGMFEFINEYKGHYRYKEILDDLMIAEDLVRIADGLVK